MRPTTAELPRGIVHALYTAILPDLRSPHPQMTALMSARLLEHLIAREERFDATLRARIPELRALLAELSAPSDIPAASDSLDALVREDEALHRALETLLLAPNVAHDPAKLARIDAFLLPWSEFLSEYYAHGGPEYREANARWYEVWRSVRNAVCCSIGLAGFVSGENLQVNQALVGIGLYRQLSLEIIERIASDP